MDYSKYTEEDFILDESFRNWVFQTNEKDSRFWESWLASHPQKKETIETAVLFLKNFRLTENTFSDQDTAEAWHTLQSQLKEPDTPNKAQPVKHSFTRRHWLKLAAVFIGILLVSIFVLLQQSKTTSWHTAYGETKTVVLPDSSVITLNANSTLTYHTQWNSSQAREVWLQGEAFLQVLKKPGAGNARFIVHTDKLKVEVLGTAFNVNSRRGTTKVVLNSGKVKIHTPGNGDQSSSLVMAPGEMVEFSDQAGEFTRKKVNPEQYSSWRNHKLLFADNTLQEIAQILEDTYGLQIVIGDARLQKRKLTGEIPSTDEQTVLEVLSESLNIRIIRDGRKVTLKNK